MLSVHIKGLRKKVFSRLAPEIAKTVSELIRAPGEPVLVSRDAAVFYEDGAPRRDMVLVELRWRTRPQEMLELAERLRVLLQVRVREPERMPELQAQVLPLQEPQEQPA